MKIIIAKTNTSLYWFIFFLFLLIVLVSLSSSKDLSGNISQVPLFFLPFMGYIFWRATFGAESVIVTDDSLIRKKGRIELKIPWGLIVDVAVKTRAPLHSFVVVSYALQNNADLIRREKADLEAKYESHDVMKKLRAGEATKTDLRQLVNEMQGAQLIINNKLHTVTFEHVSIAASELRDEILSYKMKHSNLS